MRTLLAALFALLLSGTCAPAQDRWLASNDGITAAVLHDMVFTDEGTPLLLTGHGLYRLETGPPPELRMRWVLISRTIHGGELVRSSAGRLIAQTAIDSVYYSRDDGRSWTWLPIVALDKVFFLNDSILAGYEGSTFTHFVFRGDSIVAVNRGFNGNPMHHRLLQTSNGRELYGFFTPFYPGADTSGMTIIHSVNRGLSWAQRGLAIGFDDMTISRSGRWIGANVNGTYISDDTGSSWVRTSTHRLTSFLPSAGGVWYATFASDPHDVDLRTKLARSTDDGASWTVVCDRAPRQIIVGPDGRLWGHSWMTISLSDDGGATWREVSAGLENINVGAVYHDASSRTHYAFVNRDSGLGLTGTLYSLYRSSDGGSAWSLAADSVSSYIKTDAVGGIYILKDSLFPTSYELAPGQIIDQIGSWHLLLRSSDQGRTWRKVPKHISMFWPNASAPHQQPAWVDVASHRSGRIVVNARWFDTSGGNVTYPSFHDLSVDSGATWSRLTFAEEFANSIGPCVVSVEEDGEMLMISARPVSGREPLMLWRSDASGQNVRRLSDEPPLYRIVDGGSGRLYGIGGDLYLSEDGGESWSMIYNTLDTLLAVHIVTMDSVVGESIVSFDNIYLQEHSTMDLKVRSLDGGRTWQSMGTSSVVANFPRAVSTNGDLAIIHHLHRVNPELNADLWTDALMTSHDYGDTWTFADGAVRDRWVTSAVYDADRGLVVGTWGDGLYRLAEPSGSASVTEAVAEENGMTVSTGESPGEIRLTLGEQEAGLITIELFDPLGRRLTTVEQMIDAGSPPITIDVGDRPAGHYYCRVRLNDVVRTLPFTLLR